MAGELTSISLSMGMGVVDGNVQPVLGNLSVSPSSATVGTAYTGTVSGKTAGSTLSLSGAGAAGLSVSGASITGTPTASGAVNVIETLAGAIGSPKTNAGVVSVASAYVPRPLVVGTNFVPGQGANAETTNLEMMVRLPFFLTGEAELTKIKGSFANWYYSPVGASIDNSSTVTLVKAAIERDGGGFSPLLFSGGRSLVLNPGDNDIQSDELDITSLLSGASSLNTKWWFRAIWSLPSSGNFIRNCPGGMTGARVARYAPANRMDQVDASGTMGNPTGGLSSSAGPGPIAIIGTPDKAIRSVVAVTDSIGSGSNDFSNYVGGDGYLSRASVPPSPSSGVIPMLKLAKVGSRAVSLKDNLKAKAYYKYGSIGYVEPGTNDITDGGSNAATIIAAREQIIADLKSAGASQVIESILIPRATTTDSWVTEANQTPVTGFGVGTTAETVNVSVDTHLTAGTIAGKDARSSCRGVDPWKWPVNGSANYATTDGVHPTTAIHTLDAIDTRANILSLTPA